MLLHEAVKTARKELGLSQDRFSELAGIQRRQLAKLEAGGNVTLATLRKVLAQLPNLESFTLDAVTATVKRQAPPPAEAAEAVRSALQLMGSALHSIIDTLGSGQPPADHAREQIDRANRILNEQLGLTPEEAARRQSPQLPPMTEEQLKEVFHAMAEVTDVSLQRLDELEEPEEDEEEDDALDTKA